MTRGDIINIVGVLGGLVMIFLAAREMLLATHVPAAQAQTPGTTQTQPAYQPFDVKLGHDIVHCGYFDEPASAGFFQRRCLMCVSDYGHFAPTVDCTQ